MSDILSMMNVSKTFGTAQSILDSLAAKFSGGAHQNRLRALDDVSLTVAHGQVVGLIGESGSGKSTLGRLAAGISTPDSGTVAISGTQWRTASKTSAKKMRLSVQMIFQDPSSSLPARLRVGDLIGEAPRVHRIVEPRVLDSYVDELMEKVGLHPRSKNRYPHQFSGGQRQRIAIARALSVKPTMLICDEVVSALDVSVQAQILNLFSELRSQLELSYLFVSHDLNVIKHISDRVAIMYLGRIVEEGPTDDIFQRPAHPYTVALLGQAIHLDAGRRRFSSIEGEIPSPLNPPKGCHFHPRCPHAFQRCRVDRPPLIEIAPRRLAACHLHQAQH